ncbi:MAG: ABC transporter ATP-binding protein [Acholeplasmataceae bacterium]|nr:ABC transporter ATP-binding protein [Acholeplasmataceae bacterium]
MSNIFKYLKPYKWGILVVFFLVALRAGLDLLLPMILGFLVNDGIGLSASAVNPNVSKIWEFAFMMLGISVISIIVTIISGFMESKISAGFAVDLRKAVYKKIEQFSLTEMDHFTTSSLITRTTNDIQQLQSYVNTLLRMIILQPFLAVGAIFFSVAQQPTLSMLLIVSVVSLVTMLIIIFAITLPKFQLMQKLVDKLNLVTRENLSGLRVVRAYNTQEVQAGRIDDASKETMKLNIFVNRIMSIMWPIMGLIMGLTSLGIVYLGSAYFIGIVDGFEPGQMIALMQYAMRAIMSFMFLTMIFIMIPRATISARRVAEVLNMEISIMDPKSPVELPEKLNGEIVFDHVYFQYPDAQAPVLSDISFVAKPNKTTAFIGSTGSGKSTLINLIPRFYENTSGDIKIDGIDIKDLRQEDLHKLLGYVPQQGILFSGSIKENILFGKEPDDEGLMVEASRIAQAVEFISSYDDAYEYMIAQGGRNVSGGQRQRLSIARAIAKKPLIYIFDDSFSALDYRTDNNLRNMLDEKVIATKLIVAQRINTIRHADQIIVLDQGTIVGKGTHEELIKSCGVYQEIAYSQLSKEEL